MIDLMRQILGVKPKFKPGPSRPPSVVITEACIPGIIRCIQPEIDAREEGICYLLGLTTKAATLAVSAIRPRAKTTLGSFDVDRLAMAEVMRCAASAGLQVVGQVHTHPGMAYHSDGDVDGARIAYSGYLSVVFPDYGCHLPSFRGGAAFVYRAPDGFLELDVDSIKVVGEVSL